MKNLNVLKTRDLQLAAYIRAKYNIPIKEMIQDNAGRLWWHFEMGDANPETVKSEFLRGGFVSAISYAAEMKNLKGLIATQ